MFNASRLGAILLYWLTATAAKHARPIGAKVGSLGRKPQDRIARNSPEPRTNHGLVREPRAATPSGQDWCGAAERYTPFAMTTEALSPLWGLPFGHARFLGADAPSYKPRPLRGLYLCTARTLNTHR